MGFLSAFLFHGEYIEYNYMLFEMLSYMEPESKDYAIAATVHILDRLVESRDNNYTWRESLLLQLKEKAEEEGPFFLNEHEKGQIDSYLVILGYNESAIKSEEPQEKDKEGEKISV